MADLIDKSALIEQINSIANNDKVDKFKAAKFVVENAPAVEPVRHGYWIECDYKTLEHGEIESAYKAGLCCAECRTGFKKNHMTYKAFCPACGAKMDGGADNG